MKKKVIKTEKKLSLEKFKVAELKNPRMIIGGDGNGNGNGNGGLTTPTKTETNEK
jgi:hypothetical protein